MRTASKRCAVLCLLATSAVASAGTDVIPSLKLAAEERYDDAALLRVGPDGAGQLMTKLSPTAGLEVKQATFDAKAWYALDLLLHHGSGTTSLSPRPAA